MQQDSESVVVISQDGEFFSHIHPPRLAPGRYAIALTPDRTGRYTAYVEVARQDGGTQVFERAFDVGGATVRLRRAPGCRAPDRRLLVVGTTEGRKTRDLHIQLQRQWPPI